MELKIKFTLVQNNFEVHAQCFYSMHVQRRSEAPCLALGLDGLALEVVSHCSVYDQSASILPLTLIFTLKLLVSN